MMFEIYFNELDEILNALISKNLYIPCLLKQMFVKNHCVIQYRFTVVKRNLKGILFWNSMFYWVRQKKSGNCTFR